MFKTGGLICTSSVSIVTDYGLDWVARVRFPEETRDFSLLDLLWGLPRQPPVQWAIRPLPQGKAAEVSI
jgi:hypothetical protein